LFESFLYQVLLASLDFGNWQGRIFTAVALFEKWV